MSKRFVITLAIFVAILFLPYWLYLPFLFLTIIFLPMFWEGVLLGFLVDVLYGTGVSLPFVSPVALIIFIILAVLLPVRERLRAYV